MSNTEILLFSWGFTILGVIALAAGAAPIAAIFGITALITLFFWAALTF